MGWRTVVITKQSKIDFKMNYMIVRQGLDTKKIYIEEIDMLIIESTAVSLTAVVLNALIEAKVKVIFCDEKRNPCSSVIPYYGCHNTSKRYKEQLSWSDESKGQVWSTIVSQKIDNQAKLLLKYGHAKAANQLYEYKSEVDFNDFTQREGHAAKVYFHTLMGPEFTRDRDIPINAALNYGYHILLTSVNMEVVKRGYMTQLGINHCNQFNEFNFGCDLLEPLRGFVDAIVVELNPVAFGRVEKTEVLQILSQDFTMDGGTYTFKDAVSMYCNSVFKALQGNDPSLIRFIPYEL